MSDPQNANPTPPPYEGATPPPPAYGSAPQYPVAPPAADPYGQGAYPAGPANPGKTLGIVAFILSFFLQLIAVILGIVALVQSRKAGQKNGFAVAAIIISIVLMVIGIIIGIVVLTQFMGLANQIVTNCGPGGSGFVEMWGQQVPCDEYDSGY
ncbi:DUF4190 domain-containing protein [Microbacterium sp. No. 7]|uniref:DUF4190 domain-containing protein n=1 Tax=Microbacterium sp. No. 7 TaxID=1714373 RepID=UPI0006D21885|nr:DUF4190 domain-containing protein [Microbacterium sp. No. 7]ALJ21098.1 hypothetical protein AOA12_14780 [Microbacterium sp. No. 7]